MNFDYTYLLVFGLKVYEPMIIVSNSILLTLSLIFYRRLKAFSSLYSRSMAYFMLMLGASAIFGAICHSVHYQQGREFFSLMFFGMNGFSLLSIHFCFLATYRYQRFSQGSGNRVQAFATIITVALLIYSLLLEEFLLIKVVAGLALLYSLIVYWHGWRRKLVNAEGALHILLAIASSVTSIIVHSMRISFHVWFNYKDFAHVFMILAMILFYSGAKRISASMARTPDQG